MARTLTYQSLAVKGNTLTIGVRIDAGLAARFATFNVEMGQITGPEVKMLLEWGSTTLQWQMTPPWSDDDQGELF